MSLTLLDFQKDDKLKNYKFESDFIKFWCLETDSLFECKESLRIKRSVKGKGKDSKLIFVVNQEWIHHEETFNNSCDIQFNTEEKAIEFFLTEIEQVKFFLEKNKENIVFDNLRYFWKINEKGKRLEKAL
jgi:hypothetical protein